MKAPLYAFIAIIRLGGDILDRGCVRLHCNPITAGREDLHDEIGTAQVYALPRPRHRLRCGLEFKSLSKTHKKQLELISQQSYRRRDQRILFIAYKYLIYFGVRYFWLSTCT